VSGECKEWGTFFLVVRSVRKLIRGRWRREFVIDDGIIDVENGTKDDKWR
jgi:hypothetical protein